MNQRWIRALFLIGAMASVVLGSPAAADLVFGHVSGGGFKPKDKLVLTAGEVSVEVAADEHGNYKVFLDPGTYDVTFRDGWKARIVADSEPLHQDIVLKKAK